MGAGVLPMAFHKGNIYFLFSREWVNSKEDGGLWSDFGGSREGKESQYQTAVREGGGYINLNVVERNYPYITFQTTFEKHKSQVDCTQFKLRYMSDDGSYSPWDTSPPDFRDQAKMATACHIYFSAQDFK